MWHLKTKLGTFWIVSPEDNVDEYVLGIDNDTLGKYHDAEAAVSVVQGHETGCLRWDEEASHRPTPALDEWQAGEPDNW